MKLEQDHHQYSLQERSHFLHPSLLEDVIRFLILYLRDSNNRRRLALWHRMMQE
jgi:hypothetical protein